MTGWSFAAGAVRVLRSQGHCAGHVIVHLRDNDIVHLADEGNGPCGVMHDADQLKLQTVLAAVATLFGQGLAGTLTDGHTFAVRRGADAATYLEGLVDPAPVSGMPRGLALVPAAVAMLGWKLRKRDR